MSKEDKDTKKGYTNAFWNTLEPFMSAKAVQGSLEYVAIEVLVGQAVRRWAFSLPYNWMAASETHLYSVPMIGQLNFGKKFGELDRDKEKKVELSDEAQDGAKAIPGAIVGYIAHKIRTEGLKFPNLASKEVLALLIGKVISRPLTAYIFSSLPEDAQTALIVINNLFNHMKSTIKKDDDL